MPDWLRQLVWNVYGLQELDPEMKGEWSWAGMPPPWAFTLILLGVGLSCWLVFRTYRREGTFASNLVKMSLATVRCVLLLLALFFLLQPMWLVKQTPKEETGLVLVLADDSLSMRTADDYKSGDRSNVERLTPGLARMLSTGTVRRVDVVNQVLAPTPDGFDLLGKLEKRNHRLKVYSFGAGSREGVRELPIARGEGGPTTPAPTNPATAPAGTAKPPAAGPPRVEAIAPRAETTEIGKAIQYVYDRHRHEKVAGIVVLSDGRNVAGSPPEDVARDLARADVGVPLFTVAVGLPDRPPEITVERLEGLNARYFIKNPIRVSAAVNSQGFEGAKVPLKLRFSAPAKVRLTETEAVPQVRQEITTEITLKKGHETFALPQFEIHEPGRYTGTVEIPPQKGETWDGDNSEVFEFEVRPNIRVLLVAGGPTYEFRYLRELYRRQELVNVSTWMQSAGADVLQEATTVLSKLPTTEQELAEYDVVVLIDPDPRPEAGLTDDWFKAVRELAGRDGLGFLYVAGIKFTPPILLADPPPFPELLKLLPIIPDEATRRGAAENKRLLWLLTDKGIASPALTPLTSDPKSLFDALPGFFFYLPTATKKAGAEVLANPGGGSRPETADHILWAEMPVGKTGLSMWLAGDNTWMWRGRAEEVRRQFWLQLARYLSGNRGVKAGERMLIETDRKNYRAGDTVVITGRGGPVQAGEDASVEVLVRRKGGEQPVTLRRMSAAKGAGAWQGFYVPPEDGDYEITVPREDPKLVRRKFRVLTAEAELADITADVRTLRAMARAARTGRSTPPDAEPGWAGFALSARRGPAVVEDVDKSGPAAAAGLKKGDRIAALDFREVPDAAELETRLEAKTPGARCVLGVVRGGATQDIEVRLAPEPHFTEPRIDGPAGLERLVERVEPVKKKTPTRPKGRPLWNEWWLFTAFAALISFEWAVRKANRMM